MQGDGALVDLDGGQQGVYVSTLSAFPIAHSLIVLVAQMAT